MRNQSPAELLLSGFNVAIDAGAGTGKTTTLVNTVTSIFLNDRELPPERVLLLTFTDKAAKEMKVRLFSLWHLLYGMLRVGTVEVPQVLGKIPGGIYLHPSIIENRQHLLDRLTEMNTFYGRLQVSTLHSFCLSILKEYSVEAKVDPDFVVMAPLEGTKVFEDAFSRFLREEFGSDELSAFWKGYFSMYKDVPKGMDLLRNLLRQACLGSRDLFFLPKGMNSFEEKIDISPYLKAYHLPHYSNLNLYLSKARPDNDEIILPFREMAPFISRVVNHLSLGEIPPPELMEELLLIINRVDGRKCLSRKKFPLNGEEISYPWIEEGDILIKKEKGNFGKIRQKIIWSATELNRIHSGVHTSAGLREKSLQMLHIFDEEKKGKLDFMDLLIKAAELVGNHRGVRDALKKRFRYVLVDEFQDTDPIQAYLCGFLCERQETHAQTLIDVELEGGKLFIVGDPRQSIYRFRRADPQIYSTMNVLIEKSGGMGINLSRNFRSTPTLVDFFNSFFTYLFKEESDYSFPYGPPLSTSRKGRGRDLPLTFVDLSGNDGREIFLASLVRAIRDGEATVEEGSEERPLSWGDIAILYPGDYGGKVIAPIKETFQREKIPLIVPTLKGFYEKQETKDILTLLDALSDPENRVALYGSLISPIFGFTDTDLASFCTRGERMDPSLSQVLSRIKRWGHLRDTMGVHDLLVLIMEESGFSYTSLLSPDGERAFFNVEKILILAREFDESYGGSLREFTSFLRRQVSLRSDEGEIPIFEEGEDAVRMLTVHGAKGLEFPVIIYYLSGEPRHRKPGPVLYDRMRGKTGFFDDKYASPSCYELIDEGNGSGCPGGTEGIPLFALEERKDIAEILRLSYVAVTRARDHLFIVSAPPESSRKEKNRIIYEIEGFLRDKPHGEGACPLTGIEGTLYSLGGNTRILKATIDPSMYEKKGEGKSDWKPPIPPFTSCPLPLEEPNPQISASRIVGEEKSYLFGERVHKIFEVFPPIYNAIYQRASSLAESQFQEKKSCERFLAIVRTIEKSALRARFSLFPLVGTEVPIITLVDGTPILEAADLVISSGDHFTVIDYKTGTPSPERELLFSEQVSRYTRAVASATGKETKGIIWYVERDEWIEVVS